MRENTDQKNSKYGHFPRSEICFFFVTWPNIMSKTDTLFSNEKANLLERITGKNENKALYCWNGKNETLKKKSELNVTCWDPDVTLCWRCSMENQIHNKPCRCKATFNFVTVVDAHTNLPVSLPTIYLIYLPTHIEIRVQEQMILFRVVVNN